MAPGHRPTNHDGYAVPLVSIEDDVNTSSERECPPDEFGVRSKAITFEQVCVGNSNVTATECVTITEPAGTPKVSAFHHESKHQPPLGRLPFSLDDVWCAAIFSVKSRGDVEGASDLTCCTC